MVQEVGYELEIIAQNRWTDPGSVASDEHPVIGGDYSGGPTTLPAASHAEQLQRSTDCVRTGSYGPTDSSVLNLWPIRPSLPPVLGSLRQL